MTQPTDRNLLVGILAVQMDFISGRQLVMAMNAWIVQKQRPLEEILREQEALSPETLLLLQAVVGKYLARHEQDAGLALTAISSLPEVVAPLQGVADEDLQSAVRTVLSEAGNRESLVGGCASEIDRLCDEFIHTWCSGPRPRIEEYVARVSAPARDRLLTELLQEEFHLREVAGEAIVAAEYRERFPQKTRFVERALAFHHGATVNRVDSGDFRSGPGRHGDLGSGRFQIKHPHARGGLGEVFVAHDTELNREVALKEIRAQYAGDSSNRSRFLVEAEITGRLEHPGIVPVYGLGRYADGRPYYAMRFIRGESLKETIARFHHHHSGAGDLTTGEAGVEFRRLLGRFIAVCEALEYAHGRGVLHRDLKPGNIMLGKHGETLVVDWGLAKVLRRAASDRAGEETLTPGTGSAESETAAGAALGTPGYMSPEQAAGRVNELGPATDIYSLGATLYHLLTGQPPFVGGSPQEILRRVQAGEFPRPGDLPRAAGSSTVADSGPTTGTSATPQRRLAVPRALEAICLKAMSREATDRYPTAAALAADVERYLADEPVHALAEPAPDRLRRWGRKNPRIVGSLTAGLLVSTLALGLVVAIVSRNNAVLGEANRRINGQRGQISQQNAELRQLVEAERLATADARQKRELAQEAQTAAERSEAVARTSELNALLRSGELATRRGDWQQALAFIERAKPLTSNPEQRLRLDIEKAKAQWVLSRVNESRQTLADLRAEVAEGGLRPRIRLWSAVIDSRLGPQAEEWLREISGPEMVNTLEPAERSLVRALLAPKSGETVSHLQELLRDEPFFPGAQHLLILTHLFRGERELVHREIEIARRLHPGDPNTAIAEALLMVCEKPLAEVEARIPALLDQMSESARPSLKKLILIMSQEVNDLRRPREEPLMLMIARELQAISKIVEVGKSLEAENLLPGSTVLLGKRWFGAFSQSTWQIMVNIERWVDGMLALDCMGDLHFLQAMLRVRRQDYRGAEPNVLAAATSDRLLLPLEAEVAGLRLLIQAELALSQPVPLDSPHNSVSPRILPSLMAFYAALARHGPPFGMDLGFWQERTVYLCRELQQTSLGEKFLDLWDARHPPTALTLRLRGDLLRFAPVPELYRALDCYQRAVDQNLGTADERQGFQERLQATQDEIRCRSDALRWAAAADVARAP